MAPELQTPLAWSLVIPVKLLAQAKTRLTGLAPERRSRLALAMAADTVAAAQQADSVATVLVVTDDAVVSEVVRGLGAVVVADAPGAGLNEALSHGAAYAREHWPGHGVCALAGDLPAMRPAELVAALRATAGLGVAFVPDADGTGTALYAAAPGAAFRPRFGPASRLRHLDGGAAEIANRVLTGLRRDVDTVDDLRAAAAIGLGPHTRAELGLDGIPALTSHGQMPASEQPSGQLHLGGLRPTRSRQD
jgi:2-phospho-L-lactate/phosphoenolpyruvate guanylyltransferase